MLNFAAKIKKEDMTKDLIKYLISYYQEFVSQVTYEKREYELEANANTSEMADCQKRCK